MEYWTLVSKHDPNSEISIGRETFSNHFAHNVGCTSYKCQGARRSEYLICHDMQYTDLVHRKHFWTCLTRVRSLQNFALCLLPKENLFKADHDSMAAKLSGMAAYNKEHGFDQVALVTLKEMKETMKNQKWRCASGCGMMLDCEDGSGKCRWEKDRIECHRGYWSGNIQFLCRECNASKGSYERFV